MAEEEDKSKGKGKRFTKEFVEKYSRTSEKELTPEEVILEKQKKLLEENPTNTRLWYANGLLLMDMGRNEEALKSLDKVIELDPKYLGVWNAKAEVLRRLGRAEEATQSLKKSLQYVGPKVDEKFRQLMERFDKIEETKEEERPPAPEEVTPPERIPKKPPEKIPEIIPEVIEEIEAKKPPEEVPEKPPEEPSRELPEKVPEEIPGKIKEKPPEEVPEALEELETIEGVGRPPEISDEEKEFRQKMDAWEAQGYNIDPLKETLENEPYKARTAFFQFEQNLAKISILKETLDGIKIPGFEEDIARIKDQMKSPYNMWKVEAEMGDLLSRIETSQREFEELQLPSAELPQPRDRKAGLLEPERPISLRTAEGRVNGLTGLRQRIPTPGGRTNGLVNGLVNGLKSARQGLTNGLTDPKGFTNGLGSPRFRRDTRVRRWKLFLVPLVTALILMIPVFNVPLAGTPPLLGGINIDGSAEDWTGIAGYNQTQDVPEDSVNITSYRMLHKDHLLSLIVEMKGQLFLDTTRQDSVYAFIDSDGIKLTGYDLGNFGADYLVELTGFNGSISIKKLYTFFDSNPGGSGNWSAWRPFGAVNAAYSGNIIEFQLEDKRLSDSEITFNENQFEVMIVSDNNRGITGKSVVRMTAQYGALIVKQRATNALIGSSASESFLSVEFEAIGSTVHVNHIDFTRSPLALLVNPPADFDVVPGNPVEHPIIVDTRTASSGEILTMEVSRVDADHPVTLQGEPGRAYVDTVPTDKIVDGIFIDWQPSELQTDTDSGSVYPASLDIVNYGTNKSSTEAFFYVDVKNAIMAGSKVVHIREFSTGAPAPPSTPIPPGLLKGNDFLRVYIDSDSTDNQGLPIHDLLGADYLIEVTGIHGKIKQRILYTWIGSSWQQSGLVKAENDLKRMEIGMDLIGITVNQMQVAFESSSWKKTIDDTIVSSVRSRSGSLDGDSTKYETLYGITLPNQIEAGLEIKYSAGPYNLDWTLPREIVHIDGETRNIIGEIKRTSLETTDYDATYRDVYTLIDMDVQYLIEESSLKEQFVIKTPIKGLQLCSSGTVSFMFEMKPSDELMIYVTGDGTGDEIQTFGPIEFMDGQHTAFLIPPAVAWDSLNRRIMIPYVWEKTGSMLSVEVPVDFLLSASYPVYVDPWLNYTIKNTGPLSNTTFTERFGQSVAIGDFDDDGFADLLVGAPNNGQNISNGGAAYIYLGPLTDNFTTPNVNIPGNITANKRGYAVAAGKLNNDNYWDAVVTQYNPSAPTNIYYGSGTWPLWVTTPDVTINYQGTGNSAFGITVAVGDFDNNFYSDVVIGAPTDTNVAFGDGKAFVFLSPFQATVTTANFSLLPPTNSTGRFGWSLATGQIDSDAYDDIVIGEPLYSSSLGRTSFFKGSSLSSGSGYRMPYANLTGRKSGERFGWSVAVGKLNSDSYNDIAVGAPLNGLSGNNNGKVYLYLADSNGISSGKTPDAEVTNQSIGEQFGYSVFIGPIVGTNAYNLAVGAPYSDAGGTDRGKAYVFLTPLTSSTPMREQSGFFDNENLGYSLAGGKFSSDTYYRLAIGGPRYLISSVQSGRVVIMHYIPEFYDFTIFALITLGLCLFIRRRNRRSKEWIE